MEASGRTRAPNCRVAREDLLEAAGEVRELVRVALERGLLAGDHAGA